MTTKIDFTSHPVATAWFHGQVSLEHGPDWIKPWRLPFAEIELYTEAWWNTWSLIQQAEESTGVRLRVETDAVWLQLECVADPNRVRLFDLVVKNELLQSVSLPAGETQVEFLLPLTGEPVEIWLPHNAPCAIRAICLPSGAALAAAPDVRPVMVVYGSSITHCQGAASPARTWPAVLGRLHDLNVVNLGFSGQCHVHTLVSQLLRDLPADLFLCKIGVNIFGANSLNGITFMPNVAGMVKLIREKHPTAPIALISPIVHRSETEPEVENGVGMSIAKFREQLDVTTLRLRRIGEDRHLHYVDGTLLFGQKEAADHQPDGCHPSAEGCEILGRNIAEKVIPLLRKGMAPDGSADLRPAFQNPVYPEYLADPFCFYHDGWYYAVGTGRTECYSPNFSEPMVVPMAKSRDLRTWQSVGRVLELPKEPFICFWAPEVAVHDGRFYMYYHPCRAGKGGYHIRVAVADHPEGPYRDTGMPLTDPDKNPFAIDSHAFRDDDGQWYLFYATDFLDFDEATFRGTALVVDRMTSMTELEGNPTVVMRAHWPWQRYEAQQKSHGVVADWYTLEGPTVRKRNGRYYCFYSGGCYKNETYGVDWLEADSVLGPWREVGCERGPQFMRSVSGVIGPGHHSIVTTPEGADYAVYHAWNEAMTDRLMCVDRLDWLDGVPSVARFSFVINRPGE